MPTLADFKPGDYVKYTAKAAKHYLDYCSRGVVLTVTTKRVVVRWESGGHAHVYRPQNLERISK